MYRRHLLHLSAINFAVIAFSASSLFATDSPFAGTWAIDKSKSQLTGLTQKIEDLGNDEYRFSFGDEAQIIVIDGKEHTSEQGTARTITKDGPERWKQVDTRDGKVVFDAIWEISDGGKIFTSHMERHRPDGTIQKVNFEAKRVAGTTGLVGSWESTKGGFMGELTDLVINVPDADSMTFSNPAYEKHATVKFDGNEVPYEGPRVAPGSTVAAKRVDDHTIELTDRRKDEIIDIRNMAVSNDGKTLTSTVSYPGVEKKEVRVYDHK